MTVAVLKNRIMQIAGREFDPRDYGALGMTDLARRLSDIVEVDASTSPPSVHLAAEIDARAETGKSKQFPSIDNPRSNPARSILRST